MRNTTTGALQVWGTRQQGLSARAEACMPRLRGHVHALSMCERRRGTHVPGADGEGHRGVPTHVPGETPKYTPVLEKE